MQAIFILLLFQLLGELAVKALDLPLSGNIMGMLLLFCFLLVHGRVPESLAFFTPKFLQHLALYLLPVSAGIYTLWPLLQEEGIQIILVMIISTLIPLVCCAWLLDKFLSKTKV
ncbi:CidA/LrgA family protein [Agitococcus lubricus]|uniref:Holin-like protein n=1 Tax=Agitococcus lubricus TaxID=1077255 RepID=A0A2T5IYP3_9GAMM|nr:CidA/LrgA family protein [Agitococcus lubricus]PTQ89132.1 holin-like protein [Agitococcus lubricus]